MEQTLIPVLQNHAEDASDYLEDEARDRELGEMEIAAVCRGIRQEKQATADWIREHLPRLVLDDSRQSSAAG